MKISPGKPGIAKTPIMALFTIFSNVFVKFTITQADGICKEYNANIYFDKSLIQSKDWAFLLRRIQHSSQHRIPVSKSVERTALSLRDR